MSIHDLCFRAKISFTVMKEGCKGVTISQVCSHDAEPHNDRTVQEVVSMSSCAGSGWSIKA